MEKILTQFSLKAVKYSSLLKMHLLLFYSYCQLAVVANAITHLWILNY